MEGSTEYCPGCVAAVRSGGRVRRLGFAAALVLVLGGGAGAVTWLGTRPRPQPPPPPPPPKYGPATRRIEELQKKLAAEPCDRKLSLKLTQDLLEAEVPREVIGVVDAFVTKCGAHERLQWDKYVAQKRLSEYGPAVETVTALMALNPTDHDYPWWRGELNELQGKLDDAIADYRLALSLLPRMNSVPLMLVDTLLKAGRPCEGLEPLNLYVFFHPDARESAAVLTRQAKLTEAKCEVAPAKGRAVFSAPAGATSFKAQVKLNDKVTGTFVVDTGATSVALSRAIADKLALTAPRGTAFVRTAAGIRKVQLTTLDVVQTQGAVARQVEAVIAEELPEDGLLGLSFLSRFEVRLDPKKRTITLEPRAQ